MFANFQFSQTFSEIRYKILGAQQKISTFIRHGYHNSLGAVSGAKKKKQQLNQEKLCDRPMWINQDPQTTYRLTCK